MELEKTLFRVYDRILTYQHARTVALSGMVWFFFIKALISLLILFIANNQFENKPICPQLHPYNTFFDNQTFYELYIMDGDVNSSNSAPKLTMFFSGQRELLVMEESIRMRHNFTTEKIYLPRSCYFSNAFSQIVFQSSVGLEPIILNDLIGTIKNLDLTVKNNDTGEYWRWTQENLITYQKFPLDLWSVIQGVFVALKINLALFIQSAIASLYIKMTIICAPVFIIGMVESLVLCRDRDINAQMLFRAFPWMGVYMNVLEQSQHRSKKFILLAFFSLLLLFYFLYLSTVYIGSLLLFYKSIPRALDENFFGFMAIVEFINMLFFRTRTSIYFAPKFITLFYFVFLFYAQYVCYGFLYLGYYIVVYTTIGTVCFFLYFVETKTINWNNASHYAPTIERPRCFYSPIFQLGWVNDIPQIWTMFYPLYGREFFTPQQLSYVDHNYLVLNNLLQVQNEIQPEVIQQDQDILDINDGQPQQPQDQVQIQMPQAWQKYIVFKKP